MSSATSFPAASPTASSVSASSVSASSSAATAGVAAATRSGGWRRSRRWWRGIVLLHVLVLGCALAAVAEPAGVGGVLSGVAAAALLAAITFGPLLRGVRPLGVWLVQTAGGVCLALSPLAELTGIALGPLRLVDVTYFSGFVFLILWLVLLARRVGHPRDQHVVVDAAAFTVGASLSLWAAVLAPLVGGSGFPAGFVGLVYPTLDLVLLVLAAHLAERLRRRIMASIWLVASLASELVVDLAASVSAIWAPHLHDPILAFSLFPFLGLAVAATDRSITQLSVPPPGPPDPTRAGRPTALVLFTVPPILLSTAIPPAGWVDTGVRTVLTGCLLVLLFVRLSAMLRVLVATEVESRHRATHDPLTGLFNRASLMDDLGARLRRNAAVGRSTAVVLFDCDGFKQINDTWGHAAGDTLLRDIADRLATHLVPPESLARLGGDEFVVVGTVDDDSEAAALAERVRRFFDRPLAALPGRSHTMTPSIGVVVVPPGDPTPVADLLARADAAMYTAKNTGRGRIAVFDEAIGERTRRQADVGDRLEATVADDPFEVHYMPIMGGPEYARTVGWEALVRWEDPVLGRVSPEDFIPLAERLGLIGEVGRLVLRRACRDLADVLADLEAARARDEGAAVRPSPGPAATVGSPADLAVHVNVSPTQLTDETFAAQVREALEETGLPAHHLRLEVTETLLVDEGPDVLDALHEVHALGVQMCLDDFGTGYASLATLLRLPIDCVKIDKSLVADVGAHSGSTRRAAAVLSLVESVGVTEVIAEGVETREQADTLARLGCPMVQGWLYGRAAPVAELRRQAEARAAQWVPTS